MMFIRRKGLRMEFSVSAGPGSIGGVSPTFDKADGTLQQRVLGATFQHIQSFGMTDRELFKLDVLAYAKLPS